MGQEPPTRFSCPARGQAMRRAAPRHSFQSIRDCPEDMPKTSAWRRLKTSAIATDAIMKLNARAGRGV